MKKTISIIMLLALTALSLTACSKKEGSEGDAKSGSSISVISREDGSGTRGAFIELFGIEEKDADGNKVDHTTEEADIVSKTGVMLTSVAGNENAIGYVSLGSLNDTVKAIKINGVAPAVDTIKDGTYEISRPFNIATSGTGTDTTQDFIAFILSADGQKVVEENGYIQSVDGAESFTTKNPSGKVVVSGSSSVTPVMEKLKEAYLAINSSATIEIQTSDSTTGMQDAINGTCDIGMASRDLKDSELAELTPTAIAIDGIAVIVNTSNTVSDMTKDEVKDIFVGTTTTWK